ASGATIVPSHRAALMCISAESVKRLNLHRRIPHTCKRYTESVIASPRTARKPEVQFQLSVSWEESTFQFWKPTYWRRLSSRILRVRNDQRQPRAIQDELRAKIEVILNGKSGLIEEENDDSNAKEGIARSTTTLADGGEGDQPPVRGQPPARYRPTDRFSECEQFDRKR